MLCEVRDISGNKHEFGMLERAVYGGTFDPPHKGHILLIRTVLEKNYARYIDIIPAARSPFKESSPRASADSRLQMMRLALESEIPESLQDRYRLLDIEIKSPPPSYTSETCHRLRSEFPESRIALILGSDSLQGFEDWKDPEELLHHHPILVFKREDATDKETVHHAMKKLEDLFPELASKMSLLCDVQVPCSSRDIRALIGHMSSNKSHAHIEKLKDELMLQNCLCQPVLSYILNNALYCEEN